jgi:hypothetical protein
MIEWSGQIISMQPRLRVAGESPSHLTVLGYSLLVGGDPSNPSEAFWLGISRQRQAHWRLEPGYWAAGTASSVPDSRLEPVPYLIQQVLKVVHSKPTHTEPPPWKDRPPSLQIYQSRHINGESRPLDEQLFGGPCGQCMWGARAALIAANRTQSAEHSILCFGPPSCPILS